MKNTLTYPQRLPSPYLGVKVISISRSLGLREEKQLTHTKWRTVRSVALANVDPAGLWVGSTTFPVVESEDQFGLQRE